MRPLTIAVTGLNATDNPAPGVPVIRSIRAGSPEPCRIIGLAYDPLDPGNYMEGIADDIYLMPYPSQGAQVLLERIAHIHGQTPIDVILPTLDSELPTYLKIQGDLRDLGVRMFVPHESQLRLRSKAKFNELKDNLGIEVPKSITLTESSQIPKLDDDFRFPVMVKGQFYDAYIAYSPMEVEGHFQRIRSKWGLPVIVQQFITGEEYDVVAVGDGRGGLVGAVPMRKMQLTDKGKAWGGITINDPGLNRFIEDAMSKLAWQGPCELEIMREQTTGKHYMLEINPRFPAWVFLSVGAGRNLPWATVELALGRDVAPMEPAAPGVLFLRHSFDQICTLADYEALTTAGELHRTNK